MKKPPDISLQALVIPMGLLLMLIGGFWTYVAIKTILELPNFYGHGFQYVVYGLFGVIVFLVGSGSVMYKLHFLKKNRLDHKTNQLPSLEHRLKYLGPIVAIELGLILVNVMILMYYLMLLIHYLT